MRDQSRGTGRTTKQMQEAPKGAMFVWCNSHLDYPQRLAREIGRSDLLIIRPDDLDKPFMHYGREFSAVVLDHAFDSVQGRFATKDAERERYARRIAGLRTLKASVRPSIKESAS